MVTAILLTALLLAQTNTTGRTTGHDRGNMEHRDNTAKNDTVPANATAREAAAPQDERVWNDATRIAGLLRDVQVDVPVSRHAAEALPFAYRLIDWSA